MRTNNEACIYSVKRHEALLALCLKLLLTKTLVLLHFNYEVVVTNDLTKWL